MAKGYTDEFRRDVVRMATTSGLTRPQLSSDLGDELATLNKWVQQHQHDDLMSGQHEEGSGNPGVRYGRCFAPTTGGLHSPYGSWFAILLK